MPASQVARLVVAQRCSVPSEKRAPSWVGCHAEMSALTSLKPAVTIK
jgi:hypothetical protein